MAAEAAHVSLPSCIFTEEQPSAHGGKPAEWMAPQQAASGGADRDAEERDPRLLLFYLALPAPMVFITLCHHNSAHT